MALEMAGKEEVGAKRRDVLWQIPNGDVEVPAGARGQPAPEGTTTREAGKADLPPETREASHNQDGQRHPSTRLTCSSRRPVTDKCPG